jgi:pumilio family protein 6
MAGVREVQDLMLVRHTALMRRLQIVKHGGKKEREAVAVELKGRFLELIQSKYSKFLVAKLIRLAPTARPSIIAELLPNLPRLILHREASQIVEDAFALWCSGKERNSMMRPWWGKEGGLFYEDSEGKGIKGLIEAEKDEARRGRVADSIKGYLKVM